VETILKEARNVRRARSVVATMDSLGSGVATTASGHVIASL
jgi:hypothetical protein